MAYKLGFRWRPVDFPVESTPLDTPPPCHFNPFRSGPVFDASPALNVIPTWAAGPPPSTTSPEVSVEASTVPTPWGTSPVPPLPSLPVPPKYGSGQKDRPLSTRTRSRTATVAVSTVPGKSTVDQPGPSRTTSQQRLQQRPSQQQLPQQPLQRPRARPRAIELAPITLRGVPGTSHNGIDLVSMNLA